MSTEMSLAASPRERGGKGGARSARREGLVPAIIYGGGADPLMVSVPYKELTMMMGQGIMTSMIALTMDGGESHQVLTREIQVDPVTDRPIHVDFLRVSARTEVSVSIPVTFINEDKSPGLKAGGLLTVELYEVDCTCRATNIPDQIEVDLGKLKVGETVHTSDLNLPEGVRVTHAEQNQTVATIVATRGTTTTDDAGEDEEAEAAAEG